MNKSPETYEELIRQKRCVELTRYYYLSEEELEQIYQFLTNNPQGIVQCGRQNITLIMSNSVKFVLSAQCIDSSIDGINMSNTIFHIIPHYTPSSGSSYSGGSSSNNNNN